MGWWGGRRADFWGTAVGGAEDTCSTAMTTPRHTYQGARMYEPCLAHDQHNGQ